MDSHPFELAIDRPVTRRQLLGASAAASVAVAAASLGLPAAAKALEAAGPPGLTAVQRADCLAVARTLARQEGIRLSGRSPVDVVDALSDGYARAQQSYRDSVDWLFEALDVGGRSFATLPEREQEGFLRDELTPVGGATRRSERLSTAIELIGQRLVDPEMACYPGALTRLVSLELA